MPKHKPITGKLTVATLAHCGRTWLKGGKTTVAHVVAYYRDYWELSPYRTRQLRSMLVD